MLLAAAGFAVTVYEAHPTVGGRTRRIELGDYRFDCGPTFFMMPYVLEEIFAATGRRLSDYAELKRLDPMYRLLIGQPHGDPVVINATQDIERMSRQLSAIEPNDGPAFERFIRDNRRKLEVMTPILRRPIRGLADFLSPDMLRAGPALRPWQSLYDHLKGYFKHDGVRLAMSFQSKYLGMSPFECPELFSILPFIEYEYGVWHPIGGCNALTRGMARVAAELGATRPTIFDWGDPKVAKKAAMIISVCPSGAAFAAISEPRTPPAPPWFSTITCLPSRSVNLPAISRPTMSGLDPGGMGTMNRTGLPG